MNTELIAFIAREPSLAQRLMREHRDDGTGRCCTCSSGAQTGRWVWPCQIYACARVAARRRAGRHPETPET